MRADVEKIVSGLLKSVEGMPPATQLMLSIHNILRLCERVAKQVTDDSGAPALIYDVGPVTLLRVLGDGTSGSQRIDGFYVSDGDADEDDKVREERLSSSDRLFSLIDRHGESPDLEIWKHPSGWFQDVRLCLLARIAAAQGSEPEEIVGHA